MARRITKPTGRRILESKFQADLRKKFEAHGALVHKVQATQFTKSGWPDLQIYWLKWTGHLELKVAGQNNHVEMPDLQKDKIKGLYTRGTSAWFLALITHIDELTEEKTFTVSCFDGWERFIFNVPYVFGPKRGRESFQRLVGQLIAKDRKIRTP